MDADFLDVTESSKKTWIIFILIIIAILAFGYFFVYQKIHFSIKNVELELGETLSLDIKDYLKKETVNTDGYKINLSNVKADEVGDYTYTITYNKITRKGKIKIKDTTVPVYILQELNIEEGSTNYYLGDLLTSCEDLSKPCLVELKNDRDSEKLKEVGSHKVEIIVSDLYGNKSTSEATINVIKKGEYVDPKSLDLEYASNSKNIEKFDGTIFKKFDKAINPVSHEAEEKMTEASSINLEAYVQTNHDGYKIISSEIIELYNKDSYIIGYSILIKLEKDGKEKEFYVDSEKIPTNEEEKTETEQEEQ